MADFWAVASCTLVDIDRRSRKWWSSPWWWRQKYPLKHRLVPTSLDDAASQKSAVLYSTWSVRISIRLLYTSIASFFFFFVFRSTKLLWQKRALKIHSIYKSIVNKVVDVVLLGCNAVWTCRSIPKLRRNILSPSSGRRSPWEPQIWYVSKVNWE
jgi:hypothetical protein